MAGRVALCTLLGILIGPTLAGLTRTVPAAGPFCIPRRRRGLVDGRSSSGWWCGVPASSARIVGVTLGASVVLGLLATRVEGAGLLAFGCLGAAGVALAVIDVDCHRLPDRLVVPAAGVGVLTLLAAGDLSAWLRGLAAAAVVLAVFVVLALISPAGLGLGDVKLAGLLALHLGWLGWPQVVAGLLAGFGIGAVVAIPLVLTRRVGLRTALPFGPALLLGALLAVLAGPEALAAYALP